VLAFDCPVISSPKQVDPSRHQNIKFACRRSRHINFVWFRLFKIGSKQGLRFWWLDYSSERKRDLHSSRMGNTTIRNFRKIWHLASRARCSWNVYGVCSINRFQIPEIAFWKIWKRQKIYASNSSELQSRLERFFKVVL